MEIVNPAAQQYSERYTTAEDALLKEISDFTYRHHASPHMLSGHLQGKFLQFISRMIMPMRVLEIGTFTGYSALCLAAGLEPGGRLHTIELRSDDAEVAQGYINKSIYKEMIFIHIGDAMKIIGEIGESWDLVFIDADKENYIHYFNRVLPKVRQNGFILADNVLFHGEVLEQEIRGKNAKAIQAFNDDVARRNDIERLLLPVRDGLMIMKKL